MSEIIIDNWGLSNCAYKLSPNEVHQKDYFFEFDIDPDNIEICWQNFLTSIILWDKIIFNPYEPSSSREMYGNYLNLPLFDYLNDKKIFEKIGKNDLSSGISNSTFMDLRDCWHDKMFYKYLGKRKSELMFRGFIYALYSNAMGYSYLPHPLRAEELKKANVFQNAFDANIYLDILDKDVLNIINEINHSVCKEIKKIDFPLLYHYIHSNSSTPKEELELALYLRKQKDVKMFRKSVEKIENSLSQGNVLEFKASIEQVHQISKEITNKIYKKPCSFSVSLGITPSIKAPPISFNIEKNNTHTESQVKKIIHTTFLFELASFALQGPKTKNQKFILPK